MTTAVDQASLYIYGIVAAGSPVPEGVRVVKHGGLAALVGPPGEGREQLARHDRVLGEAIAAATVVPARFGMVMDSEHAVREELLGRHAERIGALLRSLDGHVQMTLKAFYVGDALLREVVSTDSRLAEAAARLRGRPEAETRGERIWLGEVVAQAVGERRARDEQMLVERLTPVVADLRLEELRNERMVLNAQLLVRRDRREPLDALVAKLGASAEGWMAFRYVGPLAPYSFADLELAWD